MFACVSFAENNCWPITILGGGTNVLISDKGIKGLTVCLRKLSGVETSIEADRLHLTAWAGTTKAEILKIFLKYKLIPALFLAGLPGDVGGGVAMNAGVGEQIVPREFREIVDWIEVFAGGSIKRINKDELKCCYRQCVGLQPGVITRVGMSWPNEPQGNLLDRVKSANQTRLAKQPLGEPSCGSVFVNPPGEKAGALIEKCGLKGYRIGNAMISEKHGNFILNLGQAKAQEIADLIAHVRTKVRGQTGIELHTEVVYMGDW